MAHSKLLNDPLYQEIRKSIEQFRLDTLSANSVKVCHSCTLLNILPCPTNGFCYGRKHCTKHDTTDATKIHRPCSDGVCDKLYIAIKQQYASAKGPSWSQSDPTLWCSNVWEIAKCFMPVGYLNRHDIDEYDFSGTMSLIMNNKFIHNYLSKPYDLKKISIGETNYLDISQNICVFV